MDVVKLRKLAYKSIWDYGKYQGLTVHDILIMKKRYLVWAYYNLEKISFIDEILEDFAKSYNDFKLIDKPGKDPEYYESIGRFGYSNLSKQQLFNLMVANKMNGKFNSPALITAYRNARSKYYDATRNEVLSKSSLQAINHGNSKTIETRTLLKIKTPKK